MIQFSSVTQSCLSPCDPMNCSTPDLPVHHQLLEVAQTHVHWVGDAIQPSHPLSSPSPPAFNLSQHQGLFQWVSSSYPMAKVLEFQLQHQSFQWIFRTDFLRMVGSPCSPRDSQASSPTPQFKSINSLALSFLFFSQNTQDWSPLEWTGWISLQSKGLSSVFSNTRDRSINSSALSFLYSSTLTSIYDHWENHSLD